MTTHLTRMPQTEFGQPLLDDADTITDWWTLREQYDGVFGTDARLNTTVVLADLDPYQPAMLDLDVEDVLPEGIRKPDLFDDGMAFWLTGHAVVACQVERLRSLNEVLAKPRLEWNGDHTGWARVHPSAYGVDVDSFFIQNGEPAPHSAQEAWTLLAEAVKE